MGPPVSSERVSDAPTAWIVVGLGFGDCGKGTTVDALVRRFGARRVVRFNGGAQAGHNVVLPDGRHHTFAQLGAGSFVEGVGTHLASTVVVHPSALRVEARYLAGAGVSDALERTTIAPGCRVTTPYHQAAGRIRELIRGDAAHGTCGVGVGETVRDALAHPDDVLTMGELWRTDALAWLRRIRARLAEELVALVGDDASEALAAERAVLIDEGDCVAGRWLAYVRGLEGEGVRLRTDAEVCEDARDEHLVFEGAQGVLLDEHHGFHPHTTWSTCTPEHALAFLEGAPHTIRRVGVLRTTLTRHGAGPFPSEDAALGRALPEPHNDARGWQGRFRVGWPDPILTGHAIAACGGLDALALTHLDRVEAVGSFRVVAGYGVDDAEHVALPSFSNPDPLVAQEHLTRWLARAIPELAPLHARTADDFVAWVERTYDRPVAIVSAGPTHADKRFRVD